MQLHQGQSSAKPHGPALLQPDEPRTQSNLSLSHTLHCAVELHCSL